MIGKKQKQNCICYKLAVKGKVSGRAPDLTRKSQQQGEIRQQQNPYISMLLLTYPQDHKPSI